MPRAIKDAASKARRILARETDIKLSEFLAFLILYASLYTLAVAFFARASARAFGLY
jgi:hypothetical protein